MVGVIQPYVMNGERALDLNQGIKDLAQALSHRLALLLSLPRSPPLYSGAGGD